MGKARGWKQAGKRRRFPYPSSTEKNVSRKDSSKTAAILPVQTKCFHVDLSFPGKVRYRVLFPLYHEELFRKRWKINHFTSARRIIPQAASRQSTLHTSAVVMGIHRKTPVSVWPVASIIICFSSQVYPPWSKGLIGHRQQDEQGAGHQNGNQQFANFGEAVIQQG